MPSFLEQIVTQIKLTHPNLSDCVIITPSKRVGLFIKQTFSKLIETPLIAPEIFTFDNWVENLTQIQKVSQTELLLAFYEIYLTIATHTEPEPFETFMHWASMVLEDFNTIDKNLTPTQGVFDTLKGINTLYNWQWEAETPLTIQYKSFLQLVETYYHLFYNHLVDKQKGYQGMIFREAVAELPHFIQNTNKKILFVEPGHISLSEQAIIKELLHAERAELYTLASPHYATFYTKKRLVQEVSTFSYSKPDPNPRIELIGIPKKIGLSKYVGAWLETETKTPNDTTIVLLDENLLNPVLQSLPTSISHINITMGVSLFGFPIVQFFRQLFQIHTEVYQNPKGIYYQTWFTFLKHPTLKNIDPFFDEIVNQSIVQNKVYISILDIENWVASCAQKPKEILTTIVNICKQNHPKAFVDDLLILLSTLKPYTSKTDTELLFKLHQFCQQMLIWFEKYPFVEHIKTVELLFNQFIKNQKFHFVGEPLQGLQIMGFLESQLIPLQNVLLVGANTGLLPPENKPESYLPYDVRKYYNLPTQQEYEQEYASIFYNLIENAQKTTVLYNTDSNPLGGGEKSHFIEQLRYMYPQISHKTISINPSTTALVPQHIQKTPEIIQKIKALLTTGISPSSLGSYIYNPIEFYKQRILGIPEQLEIEETIAENTLGTVVHQALENLYKPVVNQELTLAHLQQSLTLVRSFSIAAFQQHYPNGNLQEGKNRLIVEIAQDYVQRFIKQEISSLEKGNTIEILAVEHPISTSFTLNGIDFPVTFKGIIDRVDRFNQELRIIDFKTGKVEASQLRVTQFETKILNYQYSKALQVLLYAAMYCKQHSISHVQAGIISFKNHKAGFIPINFADRGIDPIIDTQKIDNFIEHLSGLIVEIVNPEVDFVESTITP